MLHSIGRVAAFFWAVADEQSIIGLLNKSKLTAFEKERQLCLASSERARAGHAGLHGEGLTSLH